MKKGLVPRSAAACLLALGICLGGACEKSGGNSSSTKASTYTISGTVSGAIAQNVTMALSGSASSTTTTGSSGDYAFSAANGSYSVTPSLSGYSFTPAGIAVTVSGSDVSGVNFTSSPASTSVGDRTDYGSAILTPGGTYSSGNSGASHQYYVYTSAASDVPAIKVAPGGSLALTNSKATKDGGATSSTENSGFYGFNSGVLASSSGSSNSFVSSSAGSVTMTDCTITTSVTGATGVFAFGANATATLDHVTINTTGDSNSRGVDATYGGKVAITNSKISTLGGSCAALATDRYQGTSAPSVTATNCVGTTAGTGSPGIYCTGVFNITDCTLTNNASSGPLFFICDTSAVITLDGATFVNSSDMLLVAGKASSASKYINDVNSSWGSLGGTVQMTANKETLAGSIIICDSSSSINLALTASTLSGSIDKYNQGTADKLTLDASSKWTADADSFVETLKGVVFSGSVPTNVDAKSGVTITYGSGTDSNGGAFSETYSLPGGGTLKKS